MEENGILDINSENDLFLLHLVFLPFLIKSLNRSLAAWNIHKHSSLHFKAPEWVFNEGLRRLKRLIGNRRICTELDQVIDYISSFLINSCNKMKLFNHFKEGLGFY